MNNDTMISYEKLTVSTTAVGLASIPTTANRAVVRCETADVRFRGDGVDPTSANGMLIDAETLESIEIGHGRAALVASKFIRAGASDGTLHVAYYR